MPRSTPRSPWSSSPVLIGFLRGLGLNELSSRLIDATGEWNFPSFVGPMSRLSESLICSL
jgi:hypothetical protein